MTITLSKEGHLYFVDGEVGTISVTELLRKHGLAPTYFKANTEKRERGTAIHEDLERVCNSNRYKPKTEEGKRFKAWANENLSGVIAEQPLALTVGYRKDFTIVGTADILAVAKNGECIIADHKNMAKVSKESVAWQVSFYDYMARSCSGQEINGKAFTWRGADKLLCFQYSDGEMKTIELERIPDEEIERLIWCERNDEIYKKPELALTDDFASAIEKAELTLAEAQTQYELAKANTEELRKALIKQMKEQGIKSWETEKVKITYIPPTQRTTVDSGLLKALYPAQYLACQKVTEIKETVRITIRKGKDNG